MIPSTEYDDAEGEPEAEESLTLQQAREMGYDAEGIQALREAGVLREDSKDAAEIQKVLDDVLGRSSDVARGFASLARDALEAALGLKGHPVRLAQFVARQLAFDLHRLALQLVTGFTHVLDLRGTSSPPAHH